MPRMPSTKKKIGFCFTGEGARGAIQAGIAARLAQDGIVANFTAGVSSGSICAAAYSHLGPDGLADLWAGIRNIFSVFSVNWNLLYKSGLLNQKPMEKLVYNAVQYPPICEAMVSRIHIESGELDYVSNQRVSTQEFAEAVLGSVAITGLVQDRNGWIDAGSRQLAPIGLCVDAGCTDIYVIAGRPLVMQHWNKPRGMLQAPIMAFRALDITLFEIVLRDINYWVGPDAPAAAKKIKINVVQPTELFYETVEFGKCKAGVEFGRTVSVLQNKAQLRRHFLRHPVCAK